MPHGQTRIFLDGGDPEETRQILDFIDLDGQTTNPSLVAKNPDALARMERGERFTEAELLAFYRDVVRKTSWLVPEDGSVSIEVYADKDTTPAAMIEQGMEMNEWIPNAHIKLPITASGLAAAEVLVASGVRVNMTLCFTEEQAAAVYLATKGAKRGQVYLSPFVGRLDDINLNGMDLIRNIMALYAASPKLDNGRCHVEVLAASLRNMDHLLYCLHLGVDLVTVAQAIHWFRHPDFFAEVDRVLKPQGVLAVWGYQLLYTDTALDAVIEDFHSNVVGPYWPPERALLDNGYTRIEFPYAREPAPEFFMRARWQLSHLIGYGMKHHCRCYFTAFHEKSGFCFRG